MKKIISLLFIAYFPMYVLAQSQCDYIDSTKLYYKDGQLCNLTEHYYDTLTKTIIYNKYGNGVLISYTEYDTLMNKIQEFYSNEKTFVYSKWDKNGILRNHKIEQDTIVYEFFWNEKGLLNQYKTMKDSNSYEVSYLPNGKINSIFTCNYKKDCDCILNTYDGNGEIWYTYIWKPIKFYKIDLITRTKLPKEDVERNLLAVSIKEYGKNKRLNEEVFFKNGIANKIVRYNKDGSKIIKYCDEKGSIIE